MDKKLNLRDYCEAANDLGCEVAAVQAVAEVESAGGGYDASGRIKVRFEGHKFREYTRGKYDKTHAHLSYPYKLQKSRPHGYTAFNEAFSLDEEAALKASSFGKFQPLAVNYREAGFGNVRAFVDFLRESERNQLRVFCLMVKFRQLDDELRRKDWAGFARSYNGKAYRDFDYDGRMARAYALHKKREINGSEILLEEREIDNLLIGFDDKKPAVQIGNPKEQPAEKPAENPPTPETDSQSPTSEQPAPQPVSSSNPPNNKKTLDAPAKENSVQAATTMTIAGFVAPPALIAVISAMSDLISQGFIDARAIGDMLVGIISQNTHYLFWAILAVIGLLAVKKLCKQITLWIQMFTAARRDMNSVEVKP